MTQTADTTVTLGGRAFVIVPATLRRSRSWREGFGATLETVIVALQDAPQIDLKDLTAITDVLAQFGPLLINSMDTIADAVFDYAAWSATDVDWILDNATDGEMFAAFLTVLQMAYPFGGLLTHLSRLGEAASGTSTNLPEPNGAVGRLTSRNSKGRS